MRFLALAFLISALAAAPSRAESVSGARGGWNVLTLHYRGSWGSAGAFSLAHCVEDVEAATAFLRDPATVAKFSLEPGKVVVMGHSLGGFLAADLGARDQTLIGIALFAAWDVGHDGPVLVITAHDDNRDQNLGLIAALRAAQAPVAAVDLDTDHPFSDARIALETAVLRWLETLPGAPASPLPLKG